MMSAVVDKQVMKGCAFGSQRVLAAPGAEYTLLAVSVPPQLVASFRGELRAQDPRLRPGEEAPDGEAPAHLRARGGGGTRDPGSSPGEEAPMGSPGAPLRQQHRGGVLSAILVSFVLVATNIMTKGEPPVAELLLSYLIF
jgi:hypothetical protein